MNDCCFLTTLRTVATTFLCPYVFIRPDVEHPCEKKHARLLFKKNPNPGSLPRNAEWLKLDTNFESKGKFHGDTKIRFRLVVPESKPNLTDLIQNFGILL